MENWIQLDLKIILRNRLICVTCQNKFERITGFRCMACVRKMQDEAMCDECLRWQNISSVVVKHVALYEYNDMMRKFFQCYKFMGGYHFSEIFKKEMMLHIRQLKPDVIVPIPVHERTFNARGFNQVEGLLVGYTRLLKKAEANKAQSLKTRAERLNLENPFTIYLDLNVQNNVKICIVDDVYTTGRTLHHAYNSLYTAGYTNLCSLTLARA